MIKNALLFCSILLSFNLHAIDMSKTETWDESYKDLPDGSVEYIGGCSLHQDFENKKFWVTETLVEYFEPYGMTADQFAEKVKVVDAELLAAAEKIVGSGSLIETDDVTIEKIKTANNGNLDLYRLNIGVGGGNGMFLVFSKIMLDRKPTYELLSDIFDGDINFCDSKVWLK